MTPTITFHAHYATIRIEANMFKDGKVSDAPEIMKSPALEKLRELLPQIMADLAPGCSCVAPPNTAVVEDPFPVFVIRDGFVLTPRNDGSGWVDCTWPEDDRKES